MSMLRYSMAGVVVVMVVGGCSGSTSNKNVESAAMSGMTAEENAIRASVVPSAVPAVLPLACLSDLAEDAQTAANTCMSPPAAPAFYGKAYYPTKGTKTVADALAAWV